MNQSALPAMLAYLGDLQRSIDANENFAVHVLVLMNEIDSKQSDECAREELLNLARRHRVQAIKGRAKMEAITNEFVRRFGAERLAQERSKQSDRSARST
ncbi:hypothetical protein FHR71_005371 [Methylobacterium sp. RAS18]|nr:hypothetical protein [Methylobacterium sp. RAS18]